MIFIEKIYIAFLASLIDVTWYILVSVFIQHSLSKFIKKNISIFIKLIYIKCFLVSTEINQFLLHTNLISHLNSKYVMSNRPLS